MGFWNEAAEGGYTKMSEGIHWLRITGIKWEDKEGKSYVSRTGDPQMLLLMENQDAEQATLMVTLSDKAAWVLARLLKHSGANLDAMEAKGVTLADFSDAKFANAQLVGRQFWGECRHKGDYANIATVAEEDVPPSDLKKKGVQGQVADARKADRQPAPVGTHKAIAEEEIPF